MLSGAANPTDARVHPPSSPLSLTFFTFVPPPPPLHLHIPRILFERLITRTLSLCSRGPDEPAWQTDSRISRVRAPSTPALPSVLVFTNLIDAFNISSFCFDIWQIGSTLRVSKNNFGILTERKSILFSLGDCSSCDRRSEPRNDHDSRSSILMNRCLYWLNEEKSCPQKSFGRYLSRKLSSNWCECVVEGSSPSKHTHTHTHTHRGSETINWWFSHLFHWLKVRPKDPSYHIISLYIDYVYWLEPNPTGGRADVNCCSERRGQEVERSPRRCKCG